MKHIKRLAVLILAVALVSACSDDSDGKVVPSSQVHAYVDVAIKLLDHGLFAEGPSWRNERDRARTKMYAARSIPGTYGELDELAARAGGTHSSFLTPAQVSKLKNEPFDVPTVTSSDGIVTLTIPTFGRTDPTAVSRYEHAAATALKANLKRATCGWIVDLRSNFGGDIWPMVAVTSSLLTDGLVMSFLDQKKNADLVTVRGTSVFESGKTMGTLASAPIPKLAGTPVAVLQSQTTASASEGVVVAFTGQKNVRTFGQSTAGLSSVNYTSILSDGAELRLTVSVFADRSGKAYGGRIDPQTRTVAGGSNTPNEAISWLRSQCR